MSLSPVSHAGRGSFYIVALLAALFVSAVDLSAQVRRDSTRADSLAREIEKVVVSSSINPTIAGGAATVVVEPAKLNLPPASNMKDLLRQTPFVLVRQNSRGEIELSMRGSESRQMAMSVDGLPLTLGWDNRTDASLIPLTGVQSVTLVRGLSSLLSGPNSLGGILEVGIGSNARGTARPSELMIATGVDVEGAVGGDIVAGRTVSSAGGGSLSMRFGAGYRDRDGVPLSGDVTDQYATDDLRANSAMTQRDGFAALRWTSTGGSYLGVTATGYQTERGVAPELHIDGPRFWKYPNQARTLGVLSAGTNLMRTPFGFGRVDVRGGYSRGTVHIESFADETYATIESEERGDERLTTGQVLITHSFLFNGNLKAGFTGAKVQYEEILGTAHSDFEQRLWSSGLELEIPMASRVLVSGGVVNDASTTPETAGRQALPRRSNWGWRMGVSLGMSDAVRLHASVSERSRFPALRELYSGALNRFEPNPDLEPETLLGTEVGISLMAVRNAQHDVNVQAVAFHHSLDDAVVRVGFPGTNRFIRVNRDEVKSSGLELFGSLVPRESGLSLSADLLIQNIQVHDQIASAPRQLEHQPEFKARFEVGAPIVAGIQGVAGVRHQGKVFCLHPDDGELVELKAQSAFDVALNRLFRVRSGGLLSALKAIFAVDNLTDAAVYDICGLPQPGRNFRIGLQLS